MAKIPGGYYLKARKTQESEISKAPPHIREIWDWFIKEANHKDKGMFKEGQCLTSYNDIQEGLSWYVGWRKHTYTKSQCETAMKWLKKHDMVTTKKTTRGMFVTVCNYSLYQDPKNYENHTETVTRTTREPQTNDTINKNDKKEKNGRIKYREIDARFGDEFVDAFKEFKEMRIRMKKPMTQKAVERMLNRISKIADDPVQVLIKSVDKGWTDVYPLKDNFNKVEPFK